MSSHKAILAIVIIAATIVTVSTLYADSQGPNYFSELTPLDKTQMTDEVNATVSRNLHVVINDGFKASTPP